MRLKNYTKNELKKLGLPTTLINNSVKAGDQTIGIHKASGGRMYENLYTAWSIIYGNVRDQSSLDHFLELCKKRGFNLDTIPGLEEQIQSRAMQFALRYKGVQHSFSD